MDNKNCYPGTDVQVNKFNVKDNNDLRMIESEYTAFRIAKLEANTLLGNFDFKHLLSLHKFIFQDVYSWAGEIRMGESLYDDIRFTQYENINIEAARIFDDLKNDNYLTGRSIDKFSEGLAHYAAELNKLNPFREGNGLAIKEFIRSLANLSGFTLNYSEINQEQLNKAFTKSMFDEIELKKIFKSHFLANIEKAYSKEIPGLHYAAEYYYDKIHSICNAFSKGVCLPLNELKAIHRSLGESIEKGIMSQNNENFKQLSEFLIEYRKMQAYNIENKNSSHEISKNRAIDLEI